MTDSTVHRIARLVHLWTQSLPRDATRRDAVDRILARRLRNREYGLRPLHDVEAAQDRQLVPDRVPLRFDLRGRRKATRLAA